MEKNNRIENNSANDFKSVCGIDEIIIIGLLPSKLFAYISSADGGVSILEAKEFSVFLIKFYNYYSGSFLTSAIEALETVPNGEIEKKIESFEKNDYKYFSEAKKIISNFPDIEKEIALFLIKELPVLIASASKKYHSLGEKISASEKIKLSELFSIFELEQSQIFNG